MAAPRLYAPPADDGDARVFGRRLKKLREEAGYRSQSAFAKATSLHPITVYKHEAGRMLPRPEVIRTYAARCGVSEGYLRYGTGDPHADLPVPVRKYLASVHAMDLSHETANRMARLNWSVIAGDDFLDEVIVHETRRLIDANLARRAALLDVQREQQLSLSGAALPL